MASRYWNSLSLTGHCRNVRGGAGAGVGVEEGQYKGVMKIIAESARKERVVAKQGKINTHRQETKKISVYVFLAQSSSVKSLSLFSEFLKIFLFPPSTSPGPGQSSTSLPPTLSPGFSLP